MEYGTLYVVSVGPGDPELMTLKAKRLLERCPVIAAPATGEGHTTALDIASRAADLSGKTVLRFSLAMSRDPEIRDSFHRAAADVIGRELTKGRDVALPVLGDASIYASSGYLTKILLDRGFPVVTVPGVPCFCAAAAERNMPLCLGEEELHILPGSSTVREAETLHGTRIVMKLGRRLPDYLQDLEETGLLEKTHIASNCGMERTPDRSGYFTTLIIKE